MWMVVALSLVMAGAVGAQNVPATDAPEGRSDPLDKVICKRFIETGSLVKGYRVCKTKRDWILARNAIQETPRAADSCANIDPMKGC